MAKKPETTIQPMKVTLGQMNAAQRYMAKQILAGNLDFYKMRDKFPSLFEDGKIEQYLREHGYFDGEGEQE